MFNRATIGDGTAEVRMMNCRSDQKELNVIKASQREANTVIYFAMLKHFHVNTDCFPIEIISTPPFRIIDGKSQNKNIA